MITLIIDHDIACHDFIKYYLKYVGIPGEVLSFTTAEEALQFLFPDDALAVAPDLIFIEQHLPGMSGWNFLEALSPYRDILGGKCCVYMLTSSLHLAETTQLPDDDQLLYFLYKNISLDDMLLVHAQLGNILRTPPMGVIT
jgi:two-component SAPR family response regulator